MAGILDLPTEVLTMIVVLVAKSSQLYPFVALMSTNRIFWDLCMRNGYPVPINLKIALPWESKRNNPFFVRLCECSDDYKLFDVVRRFFGTMHYEKLERSQCIRHIEVLACVKGHIGANYASGIIRLSFYDSIEDGFERLTQFIHERTSETEQIWWKCLFGIAAGEQICHKLGSKNKLSEICPRHMGYIFSNECDRCSVCFYYMLAFNPEYKLEEYDAFIGHLLDNWRPAVIRYTKTVMSAAMFPKFSQWMHSLRN